MIKWLIGLLILGLLLAFSDSLVCKIAGIALVVCIVCLWAGMKYNIASCFTIMKACAVILVVIIVGILIMAILKD